MKQLRHRLRRWLWDHFGGFYFYRDLSSRCLDCGVVMTAEEREFYEINCEQCEVINHARLDAAMRSDGEEWERAARDVLENARPVDEIRREIVEHRQHIAGVVERDNFGRPILTFVSSSAVPVGVEGGGDACE